MLKDARVHRDGATAWPVLLGRMLFRLPIFATLMTLSLPAAVLTAPVWLHCKLREWHIRRYKVRPRHPPRARARRPPLGGGGGGGGGG